MKEIQLQTSYNLTSQVDETKLACTVGSGDVTVYATPMMIALMEASAVACLKPFLDEGETSVGVMINSTHIAATPCGMKVSATAEITAVDRKKVSFQITASDETGIIGSATHERVIVNKARFEENAKSKAA